MVAPPKFSTNCGFEEQKFTGKKDALAEGFQYCLYPIGTQYYIAYKNQYN